MNDEQFLPGWWIAPLMIASVMMIGGFFWLLCRLLEVLL